MYLLQEINILEKLNHPNIIKLQEHVQREEESYLILELCQKGDLR